MFAARRADVVHVTAKIESRLAPDQTSSEENLNVHFSRFQQFVEPTIAVVFPNQEKQYATARGGAQCGNLASAQAAYN
jgi:hypothetical protein